jgi:tRNA(Ile)-lysidine synthase TilS/MesJ
MAMLDWFNTTFNDNTSKRKLFFKIKILYVDDSFLFQQNGMGFEELTQERLERISIIKQLCESFKFPFDVINLENVLSIPRLNIPEDELKTLSLELSSTSIELITKYIEIFNSLSPIGSFKSDFNKIMKRNLIFYYALKNNFNKIVFGNSAQGLVNGIFNSVIKGRGFSVKEDIDYIDCHYLKNKLIILRPMRDFTEREILLYNYLRGIKLIYSKTEFQYGERNVKMNTKHNISFNGSTNQLISFFLDNLQERMSSTINTVLSTAEKLKLKDNSKEGLTFCGFCLNYKDQVYNDLEIGSIDVMNSE